MRNRLDSLFGNAAFYKKVAVIGLPIVIQNTITNFVELLDNVMVGRTGTDPMNAVSIVVQLIFVFNLCVWGFCCGAGIFTAQFYGKQDHKGVQHTFRAKFYIAGAITLAFAIFFHYKADYFLLKFIHQSNDIGNPEATLAYAKQYLSIMIVAMIPFAISQAYTNTLRDIGETRIPMIAGICAVVVNLSLNYILIFGNFGAPEMGIMGAAIATCVSRFVENIIVISWTHSHPDRCRFIVGAYSSPKIPPRLMKEILVKGLPLGANETFWALGITMLNQNFSLRGLDVIGAISITSTIANLFNVVLFANGESISIIVGHLLGANEIKEAKKSATRMISLSFFSYLILCLILILCRNAFPAIYNTDQKIKELASIFIFQTAIFLPVNALIHNCYFTVRTGGKTFITFLFDSVFTWVFLVPSAFILVRYTNLSIITIYLLIKCWDLLKAAIGLLLVHKGVWLNCMVQEKS